MPLSSAVTRVMRANRRTDTALELRVRSALHALGLRFRKDRRINFPGSSTRPDVAFISLRIAVFIDGCFWHACPLHGTRPKHNAWYWTPKLRRNRARDLRSTTALRRLGWTVLRFWEHEPTDRVVKKVSGVVSRRRRLSLRDAQ